jgi:hypothetical protein
MNKEIKFFEVPNDTGAVMGKVKFDSFRQVNLWSAYFADTYLGDFHSYSNAVKAMERYESSKHRTEKNPIKYIEDKKQELLEYFETEDFFRNLEVVKRLDVIDIDDFDFTELDKKLSREEFKKVYDSIWETMEDKHVCYDGPRRYISYADYRWYMLHGQGTSCWCIKEELNINKDEN